MVIRHFRYLDIWYLDPHSTVVQSHNNKYTNAQISLTQICKRNQKEKKRYLSPVTKHVVKMINLNEVTQQSLQPGTTHTLLHLSKSPLIGGCSKMTSRKYFH